MKVPKWGLIDKTGTWLIEPKIDYVDAFRDGIAKVVIDGKCGYKSRFQNIWQIGISLL